MPSNLLSTLTAGLVADRDPAQPLLTYVDGPARIELSGSTTANWISKTANLLTQGYGGPERVGLLLPLHWQTPCLLLGAVAAGATAVIASSPEQLAGCDVAFTTADDAEAALDAGVDEVFACSMTPFATRLAVVPPGVNDAAVEIPGYGDHFGGRPREARLELGGSPVDVPALDVTASDRVLVSDLLTALGALRAGAAVVLSPSGEAAPQEGVTRSFA